MMTSDPQQTVPPPPLNSPAETVVIPPNGGSPFLPPASALPKQSGNNTRRRALMVIVAILLLVLMGIGGFFIYQMIVGGKVVTIQYWGLWEEDSTMQAAIAAFEKKNPKIHVEYTKQSIRQYRERVSRQIDNGEGPDVYQFHNTWVPMLANQLSQVPADVMTPAQFSSTFYPVASGDLVAQSSIYGLPSSIDGLGLYYNEDIFKEKGLSPPVNWGDFLTIVPLLTEKNGDSITRSAIALGTANNVEHYSDILAVMLKQNQAVLTRPEGVEAEQSFIFFRNFADPTNPDYYTWNDTLDNSVYAFATGRVAMMFAPSWRAFDVKQISPTLKFKIAPIPQLPSGGTVTFASYWVEGVSAKTRYPKQAWEFAKFLTSAEGETLIYSEASKIRLFGAPYSRLDLAKSLENDPYVGAYIRQASTAQSFPLVSRTFDNGLNDRMVKYLEDALNAMRDGSSPTQALSTMASGFTQVLSTYGLVSASAPPATQ